MIIDNINNNQNNNLGIYSYISFSKLKHVSKKLFIFAACFMHIFYVAYKLSISSYDFININRQRVLYENLSNAPIDSLKIKRDLESNNSITNDLEKQIFIDDLNNNYLLMLNLTSNSYIGNWTKFSFSKNDNYFSKSKVGGITEFHFRIVKPSDKSDKTNTIKTLISLRDGKYTDKQIYINFTFPLTNNFKKYFIDDEESIIIQKDKINIDVYKIDYYFNKKNEKINKGNLTLILSKKDYVYTSSYNKRKFSPFFNIKLIISSIDLNVTINSQVDNDESIIDKVKIYSFILSFFGLIETYYSSKLIIKVNLQNELANKISILTIEINCCIKLVICVFHFFLSISIIDEEISYQFGIITIIFFFSFIGFEVKLFLLIFNIKNHGENNRDLYRRRLFFLYFMFYLSFAFILFNIKKIVTNFILIISVYSLYWLSQILYSFFKNIRPPISRLYIFWHSLSKIFMPFYIKGIEGNFFGFKPSYLKVGLIISIILVESIILILQKSLGARIIIPKKFRNQNQGFDYYKDEINIEKHVSQNPDCVICLENLSVDVDENFNRIKKKKKHKTFIDKIFKILYLDVLNKKIKKWINLLIGKNLKKKYMITPCDHVFHTVCLEKWMKQKNECPYCKQEIPPID